MSELDELKAALAATNQRLTELEESQSNHIGLDWGASGQNYPHPNQQIAVAEFGGGIMRLDSTGIQIIAPSLANAIWFLNAFSIGPGSAEPHGVIQGLVGSAADDSIVFSFTAENSENNGGLSIDLGTGTAEVRIDTYPFKLASLTADPSTTLVDAMEWYRSDTDKFRGRANGATDNFAMEAWVTAADAAHTGDADDAHDASAISILDTANDFTATDVEGALAELQSDTGYVLESSADWIDLTDAGATTLHSHTGGSTLKSPVFITPFSRNAMSDNYGGAFSGTTLGSATWPAANRAIAYPFTLDESTTVVKLWAYNGAAVSGNVDLAIYDESWVRKVSIGSTPQAGTNVIQEFNIADTPLDAGRYYMALCCDNTTAAFFRTASPAVDVLKVWGMAQQAVGAVTLPDPFVPALVASAYIPYFGASLRTLVA